MNAPNNTRMAYVAREPGQPGASSYINAEHIMTDRSRAVIDGWLARGAQVEKIPLADALRALEIYALAQRKSAEQVRLDAEYDARFPEANNLPIMLRKQAD